MFYKRKDKNCEARILADVGDRFLIESRWPKNNTNILFVSKAYFKERYGV
jgi:hypothetical protein